MGLSKLFPCCTAPEPEAEEPIPAKKTFGPSSKPSAGTDIPSGSSKSVEAPKQELPAKVQSTPELNISQRVWNRAYDELAEDEATKSLVEDYMVIVKKANNPDEDGGEDVTQMDSQVEREKALRNTVKSGRERIYKSKKLTNAVGGVSSFILKFKETIDLAVGTNPQAALPWAGVCIGLQFLLNPSQESQANEAGLSYVISRMEWYCSLTDHVLKKENIVIGDESYEGVHKLLETRITALYKSLLLYQMKSACSYYRNQGWTFIRNIISLDDWSGQISGVEEAEKAFERDSNKYNEAKTQSYLREMVNNGQKTQDLLGGINETLRDYIDRQTKAALGDKEDDCLKDLGVGNPQAQIVTIEGKQDSLVPEAFNWILRTTEYQSFTNWSDESPHQVLWLNGPAGTGKTMLMIGIIKELCGQSKRAPGISYFFCIAENTATNSAMAALRSLVWLLLLQQPHLISYLLEEHKKSGSGIFHGPEAFYSLRDTFKKMLADENLSPVYLALDALDECAGATDFVPGVEGLLSLIADTLEDTGENSKKIKWILSSRPEVNVYDRLKKIKEGAVVELDVMVHPEPVNAYIDYKLSQLQTTRNYKKETTDAISVEIHRHEQTTFLWVSLVLKDLAKGSPFPREKHAVAYVRDSPPSLNAIYDRMMADIQKIDYEEDRKCTLKVLKAVCFASRPLSFAEATVVAGLPSDTTSDEMIPFCGSFLTVFDGTIHVLHHSTGEYLVKYFESYHEGGAAQIHKSMAKNSIAAMADGLRYNICNIEPGTNATDVTVPEESPLAPLKYSCEFWVDHLCGLGAPQEGQLLDDSEAFLEAHLLHWLEALSLIHGMSSAPRSIKKLIKSLEKSQELAPKFLTFLKDAERFVLRNLSVMELAPLQTYGSALCFSPTKSEIYTRYWNERLPFLGNISGTREHWDPCLHTQLTTERQVLPVISPDGKSFAAFSSKPPEIQVWDAETGSCTRRFRFGDGFLDDFGDGIALCLTFSPDSKLLALVGVPEMAVRVCNLSTGACTRLFDLDYERENLFDSREAELALSIAISKNGDTLVIAVQDRVEIRDLSTGQCKKTLRDHTDIVTSVAYSPNGNTIASASHDNTVKIWDSVSGTCQTLEEAKAPFAVLFSPDGNRLACVNRDQTLTFWDMPSGTYSHTLGPEPSMQVYLVDGLAIPAVGFVSSHAIAVSSNGRIHVLDLTTGALHQSFNDGGDSTIISTSPASGRIVSAASTRLLRTRDTIGAREESLVGHEQMVAAVKLSPDAKTIATASMDKTVMLWNTADRTCTCTLRGHTDEIWALAFSPDGKTLVSGSLDRTARVWDLSTGTCTIPLGPAERGVTAVSFSENGAILAVGEIRGTVKLWDTGTWTCNQTLEYREGYNLEQITSTTFSPNFELAIVASMGYGAHIYEVSTGKHRYSLRSSQERPISVQHIAVSPDGKTCALSTLLMEVELWDIATGTHLQSIKRGIVDSKLSFSADGKYLKVNTGSYKLNPDMLTEPLTLELSPSSLSVDATCTWLSRGGKKVLLLPPDYRGWSTTIGEKVHVQTNYSGQVIFIEFV